MSQFSWDGLNPDFALKCKTLLETLKSKNIIMVPYSGLRTLRDQASLWRQGRSLHEINLCISYLQKLDCNYLANIIISAPATNDDKIETHAIPGLSWHNWGYALDCYACIDGDPKKPDWNGDHPAYKVYADEASNMKLTAGFYFPGKLRDVDHVQMYSKEIPGLYTFKYVNDYFESRKG